MVNYEKASFLAGIALGRQLKGWAAAEQMTQREVLAAGALRGVSVLPVSAQIFPGVVQEAVNVDGTMHFGELVQMTVSAAVSGSLDNGVTAAGSLAAVNGFGASALIAPGSIPETVQIRNVTMEVDDT